jgi:hypothetical protein
MPGLRHGGRGELQRRVGLARQAGVAHRRPQERFSRRGLRRLGRRMGGRRQGEALEGRRRGRRALQPGRRRRRGVQRRRPHAVAEPAHLGLRDARRLLRPVRPGAVAPAHAAAPAPHLGGIGLLHADPRHRLPHALRPPPQHPQARPERAGVGRVGRPRLDGGAAHRHRRRQRHRGDLGGRQARLRHAARRQGRDQPQGVRLLGRHAGGRGAGIQRVAQEGARVRQGHLGLDRQGQQRRHGVRAPGRIDLSGVGHGGQARRHGGDLRRHDGLQPDDGRAIPVDAPEARPGLALRQPHAGQPGQPPGDRPAHRPVHVGDLSLARYPQGAHEDVEKRAPAGQHGRAGLRPADRPEDLRRRHRGGQPPARTEP